MPECCRTLLILLFCWLSILAPEAVLAAQQAGTSVTVAPVGGMANARDKGAHEDETGDDGPPIAQAIAAAGASGVVIIPHASKGYRLATGSFSGGDYPSQNWSWPDHTAVYPAPGIMVLGNNRFQGVAAGDPETCTARLTNPYTQTCLTATDYKIVMDPASIWAGKHTTNVGMTIGCLPNHRNPNAANLTDSGYLRNWIACTYAEVDTGQDGQSHVSGAGFGSDISTEFLNGTLSVGSSHGIFREINVNVYGAVRDGGITRSDFILSSCGPFAQGTYSGVMSCQESVLSGRSPWGGTTEFSNAIEIGATPFHAAKAPASQINGHGETVYERQGNGGFAIYPRWTNGVLVYGAVNNFVAQGSVEGEGGFSFQARKAGGGVQFSVDKAAGNVVSTGSITAGSYLRAQGALRIDGALGALWEIGINTGRAQGHLSQAAGSDLYIARRDDEGAVVGTPLSIAISDGAVRIESALRLPRYTVAKLPTCNAEYQGVLVYVSDAHEGRYNSPPVGGGAHALPVFCDGTAWTMH
jgi:hypothetical protein